MFQPSDNKAMTVDVVIVGSGNGALSSAISAYDNGAKEVVVIEKDSKFGGTSASSGGGVWIPNNRYSKEAGFKDSIDDAKQYIKHLSPKGLIEDGMIDVYLKKGPEMIDYFYKNTDWVRYSNLAFYPDYFPDAPGGTSGNRSMEPVPIRGTKLGKWFRYLHGQHPQTQMPFGINFTQVQGQILLGAIKGWQWLAFKLGLAYVLDIRARICSLRDYRLTIGSAGVARLFLAMRDRNIPLWLNSAVTNLIVEDGRVVGVTVKRNGMRHLNIRARKGVILAAGGFERNQEMREKYLPNPTKSKWTSAGLSNTGDMISAAQNLGADTKQMDWAWWTTTAVVPNKPRAQMIMVEKCLPGSYTIDNQGNRFSNESQNYVSFVEDLFKHQKSHGSAIPCYMIFDAHFRRLRPCGPMLQSPFQPDWLLPRSWWCKEFLSKADTIEELAKKLGMNPNKLKDTQNQINQYAEAGKDTDYQRGDSVYDRYYGDPAIKPNPCLGKLIKPPFYAMALYPGEMGTAGGLVINTSAQVMHTNGEPIAGLYATGNCTSALLPRYPGPGSTLGPSMTFGYIAGQHINTPQNINAKNHTLKDTTKDNWKDYSIAV